MRCDGRLVIPANENNWLWSPFSIRKAWVGDSKPSTGKSWSAQHKAFNFAARSVPDSGAVKDTRLMKNQWRYIATLALGAWLALLGTFLDISPVAAQEALLSVEALREKYAHTEDKYVDIGGVVVHYRDEGEGPAILLIHGSQSTLRSFDGVAEKLKSRYRVVRYDVPPTGLSGPVTEAALANLRPSDIPAQLLKKIGVSKATAVGVSYGGTIALFLAAEHPDLIERVVASCAPSDPVDLSVVDFGPSLTQAQAEFGSYNDSSGVKPRRFWQTYFNFYFGEPERISADLIDETYDFSRREPENNVTGLIAQVADQPKAIMAMGKVHAPTLLLWGGRDALLPPAAMENLARRLTNTEVSKIVLPDVGHYPPLEVPERFASIVDSFIRTVTPDIHSTAIPPHLR
jgi:pimeloyl-ACP methyl ester carboxylesterase